MSEHGSRSSGADAWWDFDHRLSRFLTGMRDGEVLILSDAGDDSRYVQFLSFGDQGIHAEVSPGTADEEVRRLGWQLPALNRRGKPVGASPNFTADAPTLEAAKLAELAVRVLRDVWQLTGPHALTVEKVNDSNGPPVSDLGL
ncbi:MAG: hypothetical protein H0U61_14565 [Nocardioidaceae bacterium]|nr:hypothetical protein [Nocardioidaceae bacterium]